jgi:uncharacterized protein (AIM24 family)
MSSDFEHLLCTWCKSTNPRGLASCDTCGAPLDAAKVVSASGWREAPRLKDMTVFHFGGSTCQIEGEIVPVCEIDLAAGDWAYFEHHVLLWKEERVELDTMPTDGGLKRVFGGMPFMVSLAKGPGRVAFSRDNIGEVVAIPLHPGEEIDVRGHAFLLATHSVGYSFIRIKGLRNILHGGEGLYLDRFVASGEQGLVLLHGYGNVFQRDLADGESMLVEPGAFLYKDASVTMDVEQQDIKTSLFGTQGLWLARLTGPGRIGIQSMYHHHNTD